MLYEIHPTGPASSLATTASTVNTIVVSHHHSTIISINTAPSPQNHHFHQHCTITTASSFHQHCTITTAQSFSINTAPSSQHHHFHQHCTIITAPSFPSSVHLHHHLPTSQNNYQSVFILPLIQNLPRPGSESEKPAFDWPWHSRVMVFVSL